MQAIILLAGKGSRMGKLTENTHKSLINISENESFLSRLMHQLNEYSFSKIVVITGYKHELIKTALSNYQLNIESVVNSKYDEDTNILSVKLAMEKLDFSQPTIIIEGDVWLDDIAMKQIYEQSLKNRSIWFTKGEFNIDQRGGIININIQDEPQEVLVVKKYEKKYSSFKKMTGIMTIGSNEIESCFDQVKKQVELENDQYFFNPWTKNLSQLKSVIFDLNPKHLFSANTLEELETLRNYYKDTDIPIIELVSLKTLNPIEDYIEERYEIVLEKIKSENIWTKPIIIDDQHHLILDGHHRFEVAKELGFKVIPAIKVSYVKIPIWSLRLDEKVNHELVVAKALKRKIYPNKTVKHSFPFQIPSCRYTFESLLK